VADPRVPAHTAHRPLTRSVRPRHVPASASASTRAACPIPFGAPNVTPFEDRDQALRVLRALSVRLVGATTSVSNGAAAHDLGAAEQPFVELGERLSRLVGTEGYRALVARALHLASAEFPLLNSVRPGVSPPGRLVGLQRGSRQTPAAEVRDAVAAALAVLLWLLEQFIGRDLTQGILREVWPWLPESGPHQREPRRLTG
jgi:hypothetical protein